MSLGIPQLQRALPDELQCACRAVEVIEEVRDPSIRGMKPITPELTQSCDRAYGELVEIVRGLVGETAGDAS